MDKINPSKRIRRMYRRALTMSTGAMPVSLRRFARGIAWPTTAQMERAVESFAAIGTTPKEARSIAVAWCNDKRVRPATVTL